MKALIIAVIKEDSRVIGYRLLSVPDKDCNYDNVKNFNTYDATENQLKYVMIHNQLEVLNAEIRKNQIVGRGASLSRYVTINREGKKESKLSQLVIIAQLVDRKAHNILGYIVSDYTGKVVKGKLEVVIQYVENNGIANGKLIIRENGTKFISSIDGEYTKLFISATTNSFTACPDHPWKKEEFIKFMESKGLQYKFTDNGSAIVAVDDRITELRVPSDIDSVTRVYMSSQSRLKRLVIDNGVLNISELNQLKNLKSVEFRGNKAVFTPYIYKSPLSKEDKIAVRSGIDFKFSDTITLVRGYYCNWDTGDTGLESSESAYKALQSLGVTKEVEINDSFNNYDFSKFDFKLPNSVTAISNSFNDTLISKIDLSNLSNLDRIYSSFQNSNIDQDELVINNINRGIYINLGAFESCKFKNLVLYSDVGGVDKQFINNIEHIEISSAYEGKYSARNTSWILRGLRLNSTVEFKNKQRILSSELESLHCTKVILNEGLTRINAECAVQGNFEIQFPTSLERIDSYAFENFYGNYIMDLSKCNLNYIGTSAFEGSLISGVLLPNTLTSLECRCFKDALNLKYIYIPDTIAEFGRACFQGCGSNIAGGTVALVYKGSKGEKYCKQAGLKVVHVESFDDAMNKILKIDPKISEAKKNKIQLILSGEEDSYNLLSDKFINRAIEFRGLADALNKNDESRHILNADNLISIPIEDIFGKEYIIDDNRNAAEYSENSIIELINIITKCSISCNSLVTNKRLVDLIKNDNDEGINKKIRLSLYANSQVYKIYKIKLRLNNTDISMLIIVNQLSIIYCTMINVDKNTVNIYRIPGSLNKTRELHSLLSTNFVYPIKPSSYDFGIPINLKYKLASAIRSQLLLVAVDKTTVSTKQEYKVLMLSLANGDILECSAKTSYGELIAKNSNGYVVLRPNSLETFQVHRVYSKDDINEEIIKQIRESMFNSEDIVAIVRNNLFDKDCICSKQLESKGTYDDTTPCIEWEYSKMLQDYNISSPEQLDSFSLYQILNTDIFLKIKSKPNISDKSVVNTLVSSDGKAVITSYRVDKMTKASSRLYFRGTSNFYIRIVGEIKGKNIDQTVLSNLAFREMFKCITEIRDPKAKPETFVDNNEVDLKDFYIIRKGLTVKGPMFNLNEVIQLVDAINKASGCVFTLINIHDIESKDKTYKILRFNSLNDAITADTVIEQVVDKYGIVRDGAGHPNGRRYLMGPDLDVITKGYKPKSSVMIARDYIIRGYPKEYVVGGVNDIFKLAAKQPFKAC